MTFYNSHDTLIFIAQQHGYTALLGKRLKAYLPDYAPQLSKSVKNLIYAVYDNGAAEILYKNLDSEQADKELAVKQAVALLTEAYIVKDAAESIIREFAEALGWRLDASARDQRVSMQSSYGYSSACEPTWAQAPVQEQGLAQPPAQAQGQAPASTPALASTQTQAPTQNIASHRRQAESSRQILADDIAGASSSKRRVVRFGGYSWQILDNQINKVLLISENIIEKRPYNIQYTDVTWETCSLRRYLNGEFLSGFDYREQNQIIEANNANNDNQWYAVEGGKNTTEKVFLLSIEEVVKYFGDSGRLKYWKQGSLGYINDLYNHRRSAAYGGEACWWWLRSPGGHAYNAANVGKYGHLIMNGNYVDNWEGGVRPAIWLSVKKEKLM